ncbi:hypothetical protein [Desulforamulus hydrothermalis]|nr:hypothetical protein [Desulforamulus hydrothermalis]SHG81705.1 hypothetical protein SAMN02745177_00430 [Desulforamulus hydrothermalis Lam5 = DSM 18033]
MKKQTGRINRQEAARIARQITRKTGQERLYGYDPTDDYAQGTPMA